MAAVRHEQSRWLRLKNDVKFHDKTFLIGEKCARASGEEVAMFLRDHDVARSAVEDGTFIVVCLGERFRLLEKEDVEEE